ncbi:preprotein translocase subunit SecE [Candidatus Azambacteria bacterium RBG_16_47_10]|uniref:Protein translocase subunit SecE n=1 Tax=Candidatus Azambacteria bacterium RBG_16_47_10 TaxID=1797292 RepID=A0A1F5B001_9BACT|nr:MAG: preprotein translocase subunit SecE [Candidatus Azambacteria bacterium RBG_16_47_10]
MVFLREVRVELRKTSFPDRHLTTKNTAIVIAFSIAIALFLGGLDMGFSYILNTYIL